jgi:protocatechuate 3,4-dioxygenase, beta subunit
MNELRRNFNRYVLALPALFLPFLGRAQAPKLLPTPQDTEGPFYPVNWDGEVDADLLSYGGKAYLQGTPMTVSGKVQSTDGRALVNARLEIWQTDETGNYRHPNSAGEEPAKRGFQGYGKAQTDAQGAYAFRTIKPVLYGGRPPHVHFKVVAPGHRDLITQMYFAGDNREGNFLVRSFGGFSKERDRLTVSPEPLRIGERDALAATFNIVLAPA